MATYSKTLELRDKMSKNIERINKQMERMERRSKLLDKAIGMMFGRNAVAPFRYELSKISGVIDTVKNKIAKIPGVFRGWNENIKGFGEKLQRIRAPDTKETEKGFVSWQNQLTGIIGKLGVVAALIKGIGALPKLTDDYTKSKARLNLVNDGSQTTEDLTYKMWQSAQRTGADYTHTRDMTTQLSMNAPDTFQSNDEAIAFSELVNKSFDIAGTSDTGKESVIYNLTQALSSGVLRGQDLNAVLQNTPTIVQNIADYLGVPIGQIKEMATEGQITASVVKNAMFSAANDINTNFEKIPMTWGRIWTEAKNTAYMFFMPVFQQLENLANSPAIEGFKNILYGIMGAVSTVAGYIISAVSWVAEIISNNIEVVKLGLLALGIVLSVLAVQAIIAGTLSAIGFMLAHMPLMLLIAGIGLVIFILNKMGVIASDVLGFIGGLFGWLYGVVYNIVAQIWNLIAGFFEFFGNASDDLIGSTVRAFAGLADSVLGLLETIAGGIDAVFGSNLAATVSGWREGLSGMVAEKFGEPKYKVPRMEEKDISQMTKQGIDIGQNLGNSFQKLEDKLAPFKEGTDFGKFNEDGFGNNDVGEVGNVGSVDEVKGDVNIADEDIKLLKDVAMLDFQVNLAHTTPTINMSNSFGDINNGYDADNIIGRIQEEFIMATTGDLG